MQLSAQGSLALSAMAWELGRPVPGLIGVLSSLQLCCRTAPLRTQGSQRFPGRMDEESLQTALQTYDAQLQQVELALGTGLDPSALADLRQLQGDLKELIELTEASLVSVRKSKLLATLDGEHPARDGAEYLALQKAVTEVPVAPRAAVDTVTETPAGPEPSKPGREEEEGEEEEGEEEEELSGRKVNAPYYSPWGTLEYHNAMIVGTEEASDGSAGVRVLYLYPTHKALKTCPFYLEGKCRFKEHCR